MPNRSIQYEPDPKQDPVMHLTLAIRGLKLGDRLTMPDGTMVRSTSVQHGSSKERRFAIIPPATSSTPQQRHRAVVLNHNTHRTAEETAKSMIGEPV